MYESSILLNGKNADSCLNNGILLPALTLSCNLMMVEMWQSYRCNALYNCRRCHRLFSNFLMDFMEATKHYFSICLFGRSNVGARCYCRRPPMHYLWRLQCRTETQTLRARKFKTILYIFWVWDFEKRMIICRRSCVVRVVRNTWKLWKTTGTEFFPLFLSRPFQNGVAIEILKNFFLASNRLKFYHFIQFGAS